MRTFIKTEKEKILLHKQNTAAVKIQYSYKKHMKFVNENKRKALKLIKLYLKIYVRKVRQFKNKVKDLRLNSSAKII